MIQSSSLLPTFPAHPTNKFSSRPIPPKEIQLLYRVDEFLSRRFTDFIP